MVKFLDGANTLLRDFTHEDRLRRNVPVLIIAALPASTSRSLPLRLEYLSLDEVFMRGTLASCDLKSVLISKLDVRGADLTSLSFTDCQIAGLVADGMTVLPTSFPDPGILSLDEAGRPKQIVDERQKKQWINENRVVPDDVTDWRYKENKHERLFYKLCRVILRQQWIRSGSEDHASRLIEDPRWSPIRDILNR